MSSSSNIVEMTKQAIASKGAIGLVPLYGTFSVTGGAAASITDVDGNTLTPDFNGRILFGMYAISTSGGNTVVTLLNGATTIATFAANTSIVADIAGLIGAAATANWDYSAMAFSAGDAFTIASATETITGNILLLCLPTT